MAGLQTNTVNIADENVTNIPTMIDVFKEIDDEDWHRLKAVVSSKGKGRRPKPPAAVKCTNRLMLQSFRLHEENLASWEKIEDVLTIMFPLIPGHRFKAHIERVADTVLQQTTRDLSFYNGIALDVDSIGKWCDLAGLNRQNVFDFSDIQDKGSIIIIHGVVKELVDLAENEKNVSIDSLVALLQFLSPAYGSLDSKVLKLFT